MGVIDWLQTFEFIRGTIKISNTKISKIFFIENSERFTLYCLCGCLIGISIILISIIILLYIEKHLKMTTKETDLEYDEAPSYLPVYRYDGRNHSSFYHV